MRLQTSDWHLQEVRPRSMGIQIVEVAVREGKLNHPDRNHCGKPELQAKQVLIVDGHSDNPSHAHQEISIIKSERDEPGL